MESKVASNLNFAGTHLLYLEQYTQVRKERGRQISRKLLAFYLYNHVQIPRQGFAEQQACKPNKPRIPFPFFEVPRKQRKEPGQESQDARTNANLEPQELS